MENLFMQMNIILLPININNVESCEEGDYVNVSAANHNDD